MPEYQVIGGRVVTRGPTGTGTLEGLIADLQGMKATLAMKAEKTELPEVLDTLDSNRADAALSPRQGKVLDELIDGGIPKGFIGMWSGLISEIPAGWALCDGQDGRPNLLGKFIRGVPTTTNPGNTGGSDSITLSEANLPAHKHDVNAETTGHSHTIPGIGQGMLRVGGNQNTPAIIANQYGTPTSTVKDRIYTSSSTVGGGQAFDNRPAYYELAYVIKL